MKGIKIYISQLTIKLLAIKLKQKLENRTKARCQLENKAMEIKLTNTLRGKERKNRYAKLNRGR